MGPVSYTHLDVYKRQRLPIPIPLYSSSTANNLKPEALVSFIARPPDP